MDDAGRVGHFECVGNLYPKVQKLVERNGLALDAILQRRALQAFHNDEKPVLVFADVVDGADVGMIQRGRRARFPLKSFARLRILCQFLGKELQGHAPAEALVFRLIHNAHSAAAQLSYNAVMGDCLFEHVALNVRLRIEASQFQDMALESEPYGLRRRRTSWPLRDSRASGRGRNGRGLQGARHQAATDHRVENAPRAKSVRCGPQATVFDRGAGRVES